jgi:stage II sporulation protein AA (anti-sigma F factor antagonist)
MTMVISKYVTEDGVTILRLSGKLIASTLDPLKTALDTILAEEGGKIILNLKLINIIDSVAVGLLVSRFKTAQKKKTAFKFCELQPAIKKLLSLADLDKWLEIYDNEDEARTSIKAEG